MLNGMNYNATSFTPQHQRIRISLVAMTAPCHSIDFLRAEIGADPGSIPGFGEITQPFSFFSTVIYMLPVATHFWLS